MPVLRHLLISSVSFALLLAVACGTTAAGASATTPTSSDIPEASADSRTAEDGGLSIVDAVVLGVVEGFTEYLPVSSTGHLLLTTEVLGLADSEGEKAAVDAYVIVIQFGAIVAVLVLYRRRIWAMLRGIAGRDPTGRHLAIALIAAVVPAVLIGLLGEQLLKDHLFHLRPIVTAWLAGGLVILAVARRDVRAGHDSHAGAALESLSVRGALVIGLLQCVAMWPGVSRSLATILGGRLIGLSTQAAVEFSFLLGLVTLTGASLYETAREGGAIIDTLGVAAPLFGILVAFVAAALSIKWMVGYLNRHSLAVFGWYRIGIALLVAALLFAEVV